MIASAHTLESGLFRGYWDDGLLDVLAGIGILGVAACWSLDLIVFGAIVPAVLAPFWGPLRRALVEPRVGLVEFSDARAERMRRIHRGTLALGVAMLLLVVTVFLVDRPRAGGLLSDFAPAIPALLLALMAVLTGWGLGLPRFLAYAALLGLTGCLVALADGRPEAAIAVGGGGVLASGVWRLLRFVRLPVERGDGE